MSSYDIQRRSIAIAAAATDFFERTQIFKSQAEIRLDPDLSCHVRDHGGITFEAIRYTTTVRNYAIENVVLDTDTLLLIQDDLVIPETDYFVPGNKDKHPVVYKDALTRFTREEDVIVGFNNAHQAYQHWLTQCLPAIDWSLRRPRNRPVRLVLPTLEPWQEDFLRLLGYEGIPRLIPQAGMQYFFNRLEYSEFLNGSTSFSVCLSGLNTAKRILAAMPSASPSHKVVYVPCTNPYYGSISNEAEVIDLLLQNGVYILQRETLAAADRVALFRHADLVIGPNGEGLTDVVFCKPGATLWEWMPKHLQNASFNRLAQANKLDYRADLFSSAFNVGESGGWLVDVARVVNGLSEVLKWSSAKADTRFAGGSTKDGASLAEECPVLSLGNKTIDELLLEFESLGNTCAFGLVQRYAGVEPLGLLRFAGIALPAEQHVAKLIEALRREFEGLGAPGTIALYVPALLSG